MNADRHKQHIRRALPFLIPLAVLLLYLPYIDNPLVFDDLYFFLPGNPERYVEEGFKLRARWLSYYSHALTFVWFGDAVRWQRLGNLAINAGCGLLLYGFILRLLEDLASTGTDDFKFRLAALTAALFFVLHPATVFSTGYLIQRTTLLATLFSISTWWFFWYGLHSGARWSLCASVPAFALAALSKEHCVMAPAVSTALLLLHARNPKKPWKETIGPTTYISLACQFLISSLLLAQAARLLGTPYELAAQQMLEAAGQSDTQASHMLSALTQSGLFFKYLLIWALPLSSHMAVDMREPFLSTPLTAVDVAPTLAFSAIPFIGAYLIYRGGKAGLVGIGLTSPWLLFATELSTIRIQEVFVLYRSYLWIPPLLLIPALGLLQLRARTIGGIAALSSTILFIGSIDLLESFRQPIFLWDDAVRLVENRREKSGITGIERLYHNRGLALSTAGMEKNAIDDFSTAISIRPSYAHAYSDRGSSRLKLGSDEEALRDFDAALKIDSRIVRAHEGRALALARLGRVEEAAKAHAQACELGWKKDCELTDLK